ncbi:hypothetical protein ALP72_00624 [Pseudomonas coronafaciens pv. coronafaciens]|uniref:hypothetical protein n=1 Tax=Pseudomonas coronafaciens TaxID=53409 RepID=UPI000F00533B|nr:hypothetical protein [Pseudomonas coronafaciens]RMS08252.1 hypothetical protein ALP72_00624 [Pseudomonas coronafaciens pv. coronafaciens]
MWFSGGKDIPGYEHYRLKHVKTNAVWEAPSAVTSAPMNLHPAHFLYGSTRSSIMGKRLGLRGQLAGLGLGSAALCYLRPDAPSVPLGRLSLHGNFNNAKDFVGTTIKGVVGASLAYWEMQHLGYAWEGHWEDFFPPSAVPGRATPAPDFIFASDADVCLVDAKGSSRPFSEIGSIAKGEWKRQIYPNRNAAFKSGGLPTEGRVIALVLDPNHTGVGLVTAYGRFRKGVVPAVGNGAGIALSPDDPSPSFSAIKAVQKVNFTNVLFLLGLYEIAGFLINDQQTQQSAKAQFGLVAQRTVEIGGIGMVYTGASRFFDLGDQGGWVMRPFCHIDTLREVYEAFVLGLGGELSTKQLILPKDMSPVKVGNEPKPKERMVVQSRDGVGAVFERVINP